MMSQSDPVTTGLINLFDGAVNSPHGAPGVYKLMGALFGFMLQDRFHPHCMDFAAGRFRQVLNLHQFKQIFSGLPELYNLLDRGFSRTIDENQNVVPRLCGTVGSCNLAVAVDQLAGARCRVRLYIHLY